ncbi:MAG: zf-HC2 domain-containing protein [Chthonomonadales bacterium]
MNCKQANGLISEYIDNQLSARDTWELDRHFGECNPCQNLLNEMRQTVNIVAAAPEFKLSDDFASKLSARLALVQPAPPRNAWLSNLREAFRPGLRPAWVAGLGTCAIVAIMLVPTLMPNRPVDPRQVTQTKKAIERVVQFENVSNAVSDPFGDTAAASMVTTNSAESAANATNPEPIW